jgi:hypothetical protein
VHRTTTALAAAALTSAALVAVVMPAPALAQLDPCQPPVGQQMADMRINGARGNYREAPTPANKVRLCQAYDWAVKVYTDAVGYCRRSACEEASFRDVCGRREERLVAVRAERRRECGR